MGEFREYIHFWPSYFLGTGDPKVENEDVKRGFIPSLDISNYKHVYETILNIS